MSNVTHARLAELIGEVQGISLESKPTSDYDTLTDVVVYLELSDGARLEIIRALRSGEGIISHTITREGIRQVMERGESATGLVELGTVSGSTK